MVVGPMHNVEVLLGNPGYPRRKNHGRPFHCAHYPTPPDPVASTRLNKTTLLPDSLKSSYMSIVSMEDSSTIGQSCYKHLTELLSSICSNSIHLSSTTISSLVSRTSFSTSWFHSLQFISGLNPSTGSSWVRPFSSSTTLKHSGFPVVTLFRRQVFLLLFILITTAVLGLIPAYHPFLTGAIHQNCMCATAHSQGFFFSPA